MDEENRHLTLKERWEIDKKSGATFQVSSPQCKMCSNFIKGEALKCNIYIDTKPNYVLACKKECLYFESKDPLHINVNGDKSNMLFGGVMGFCVGDALGVPAEFESREEREKDPIQEMRAYGTHHQYFGTWSDDTSLTLCLLESLARGYNINDVANNFVKFYIENFLTPFGNIFDIGNTTRFSIERVMMGVNPIACGGGDEKDNGNGSLMRVLPLAFYIRNFENENKIKIIEEVSSITHSHKRSKLACILYVEIAINLLKECNKKESYEKAVDFVNEYCYDEYKDELICFKRVLSKDITLLYENEISASGYVVDTLESAIWCFLTTDNYKDSIFKAINLGDDTDTVAAITGGLSGILYGVDSIPYNWIQCLARKNDIYELILEFSKVINKI